MNRFSSPHSLERGLQPKQFRNVHEEELRIVIIGKTGTGKSATGNNIIGEMIFESIPSASSITNKCKLGIKKRFGRKIVLVDTPGLFDTEMSNELVTKEIVKCIGMTAPGPHAILLIVSISRFTKEDEDTVKHFETNLGNGIYNFLTVVFTRAEDLGNTNIESYLEKAPQNLKEMLQLCDNRYVPFNNKLTGDDQEHQVKLLISRIDDAVNKNEGRCFTNEMYQEVEKTLRRQEEEMKGILQEEKRKSIKKTRCQLQYEVDKKFAEAKEEKDLLEKARTRDRRDPKSYLENQSKEWRLQDQNRILEDERQRFHRFEGLFLQKGMTNDDFDEQLQKLQKQIEENDRKRENKIQSLKKENERKIQEIRDEYEQRLNLLDLRDDNRRACEKETGIFSKIWTVIKGAFKVANALSFLLPDDKPFYEKAKKALANLNSTM